MLPWYGGKIGFMANEDRKKERAFAFAFVRSLFPVCAACHLYLYSLDGDLIQGSRIRLVLGCVISPLRQHAESHNLGQTLFGSPVEKSIFCAVPHQYALLLTANMRIARVLVS